MVKCKNCGKEWDREMRFCGFCGTPLPVLEKEEERKKISCMFIDVAGFTSMSDKKEPEEVKEILDKVFKVIGAVISRNHGKVDKLIGDAALVLFGIDKPLENHAYFACKSALEIMKETEKLGVSLHFGINSGEVLLTKIGDAYASDFTVLGDTVNLAQRLESLTGKNEIFISESTYRLVKNLFEIKKIGDFKVKGKEREISVYKVLREKEAVPFREISRTKFVGRKKELNSILKEIEEIKSSLIAIRGEAGIGKTRLVDEAIKHVEKDFNVIGFWGVPDSAPLKLLSSIIEREEILDKNRIFIEFKNKVLKKCVDKKLLFRIEDLHWADELSVSIIIDFIMDFKENIKIIITERERTEFFYLFEKLAKIKGFSVLEVTLQPLSEEDTKVLIKYCTGGIVKEPFFYFVLKSAKGNPLFVEEISKTFLVKKQEDVPLTLDALILKRVENLEKRELEFLKVISCLGFSFDKKDLEMFDIEDKEYILKKLVEEGIVYIENSVIRFKHPLLREVIYNSIPRNLRKKISKEILIYKEKQRKKDVLPFYAYYAEEWEKVIKYAIPVIARLVISKLARDALRYIDITEKAILNTDKKEFLLHIEFFKAKAFYFLGEKKEALNVIESILRNKTIPLSLKYNSFIFYYQILSEMGEFDRVFKDMERVCFPDVFKHKLNILKAKIFIEKGLFKEAENILKDIIREYRVDEVIEMLAETFFLQSKFDDAIKFINKVLNNKNLKENLTIKLRFILALSLREKGDLKSSEELFRFVMNVMEEKGYKEDWHTVLYEFSKLLSRKGDFERAEIYIEEALRFSIYNNAKGLVGHIFTTKAINYERQGMLEKAQEIWNKALEYTEKENLDFQKAMILHNMGNFSLMYKGELLKAFELYKGSLKIYEKYNTDFEILLNRCLLALIKLIKGEDVKQEFKEIIKLSKELKIIPLKNLALWGYSFYDIEFIEDFRKDPFFSVFFTSSKEEFKKNLLSLIELQRVNRLRLFLWGSIKIIPALEQEFKRIYIHVVKEKKLHPFYLKNIPFTIH